ncbi:AAA family ATPase [Actinopolymorpha sp. B17G11]|uniref:ATP-binding protein n=1 Tax=Actinopolymorpha sp. B17G11 TaxID=3160861 RepID=UPI0032E48062
MNATSGKRVVSPILVGRSDELERLVGALSDPPAVVVIEGEAGIGKTRLVRELWARSERGGGQVVVGWCQHVREPFPLGPLIEAMRRLGNELGKVSHSPLVGALRPLLPELADALPPTPEPLDDRLAARHRVFRALVEVLESLGAVVLVLEDLHWADEQTIDFLRYMLCDPPSKLGLVLTFRAEEVDPEVRALTARLPESIDRTHVVLVPLDATETGTLAAAILGTSGLSKEFADYLHDRTSGLPFAIEELLALLRTRGSLVLRRGGWARRTLDMLDVPTRIRDSVLERVSRLSDEARAVAEAAAVLETPVPVSVLLGVGAVPAQRRGLGEALASGVLTEYGEAVGFRHLLAAQAVYDDIPVPYRQDLHARAATTLAALEPPPLGRMAHHLRHADRLDDWVKVAEQAADQASTLGDDDEAARVLEAVLRHGRLDGDRRGRLAVKLARVALEVSRGPYPIELLSEVLEQGQQLPRSVRGELRLRLALLIARAGGDLVVLHSLFSQSVDELDDQPELRAWAMVCLGMPTTPATPLTEHTAWLHRSLAVIPAINDRAFEVFLLGKVAMVFVALGDPEWRRITDRILERTDRTPRQQREVSAYCSIGLEACYAGHHDIAADVLTVALDGATRSESRRTELGAESIVVLLDYCRGNWDGLSAKIEHLIDDLAEMPRHRIYVEVVAGCLALARGELDNAKALLVGAVQGVDGLGDSDLLPMSVAAATRVMLARGEVGAAVACMERFLAVEEAKGTWAVTARILPSLTRTMLLAGRRTEAAVQLSRLAAAFDGLDAPLAPAALHHARGLVAADARQWDAAARHLLVAGDRYERLSCPYEAGQAREEGAACLFAAGAAGADEQLKRAMAAYLQLGATWDWGRAAGVARQHGVDVPRPRHGGRRSYGDQLSPRELEVAELAADGHTNREIAERLFLAPRTVDTHLGAVRRKLGVRSRVGIARRLAEGSAAARSKNTQFT